MMNSRRIIGSPPSPSHCGRARACPAQTLCVPVCSLSHLEGEAAFRDVTVARTNFPIHAIDAGRKRIERRAHDASVKLSASVALVYTSPVFIFDEDRIRGSNHLIAEKDRHIGRGLDGTVRFWLV